MASNFYKISCIDSKKECNIIDPISQKLDFAGYNPVTGRLFSPDDIKAVTDKYSSMCVNKNGIKGKCCDPKETRFTINDDQKERYKDKKVRVNREYGVIKSIDICNNPSECSGSDWITPNPYLMCKIGDNQPNLKNNVLRFDKLNNDCYSKNCNSQGNEISFGELISGIGKDNQSSFVSDLKINEHLKEDNYEALKKYLDTYKQTNKKSAVDNILTDTDAGDTILLRAIKLKANKCINVLFGYSVDLNIKATDSGMSPLHYACQYGDETMVGLLINAGARTDILDFKGRPPFFYAIMYGNINMIQYLANQNPGMISIKDKHGNNALHIAMKYAKESGPIVKYLIDHGISSQVKNNKGNTPSDIANNRLKHLEIAEQEENSEMFLEPFITLGKAEEEEPPKNKLISKLETGVSIAEKAHVNENQFIYNKFVSPLDNLKGPVDFNNYGCYPYANLETEDECKTSGGHWLPFEKEQKLTTAKVEYKYAEQNLDEDGEADDLEYELNGKTPEDKIHYYKVKSDLILEKKLPSLDHDSIMCNEPTPTPTFTPSATPTPPYKCPIPTETLSPSFKSAIENITKNIQMQDSQKSETLSPVKETMEGFENNTTPSSQKNNQYSRYDKIINIAIITIITIIILLLLHLLYKKYKN